MLRKLFFRFLPLLLALVLCLPAALGEEADLTDHEAHVWVPVSATEATCAAAARTVLRCEVCGAASFTLDAPATAQHDYDERGVCRTCGWLDLTRASEAEALALYGFVPVDTDGSATWTSGDQVLMGLYPQSLVMEDDPALTALRTLEDPATFVSYGYYSAGEVADYMRFLDTEVDGVRYRGVYMTDYRPYYTGLPAGPDASYIDDGGYALETVYWFRFDPIVWNVLDYHDGELLLNAARCLDAQPYQALYQGNRSNFSILGSDTLVNDWAASSIRSFLNDDFLHLAFTPEEQALIAVTRLDNRTTGYEPNAKFQITQQDTEDQLFLLSYADLVNPGYGYPETASFDLAANGDSINDVPEAFVRRRSYTPYAAIQGCRPSSQGVTGDGEPACYYMLRSAGNLRFSIAGVSKYGSASYSGSLNPTSKSSQDGFAVNGDFGLLPAMNVKVGVVQ